VRIRHRIFLAFAPVVIAGFYLLLSWILRDIRPQPLKAMEESLVDTANILAALLEGRAAVDGAPDPADLRAVLDRPAAESPPPSTSWASPTSTPATRDRLAGKASSTDGARPKKDHR
jgi:hypothetical protein